MINQHGRGLIILLITLGLAALIAAWSIKYYTNLVSKEIEVYGASGTILEVTEQVSEKVKERNLELEETIDVIDILNQ